MGEWIEHDGMGYPVPDGTLVTVRYRNGETESFRIEGRYRNVPNGILPGRRSIWFWALHNGAPRVNHNYDAIAYRLHDDGQSEAETRKARMNQFYKIAAGKDHLIEETLKTRKLVSAPQKAGE